MPPTEITAAYPWQSEVIYAAELDVHGGIIRGNVALAKIAGETLEGLLFGDLLAAEQRPAFERHVEAAGETWARATFGFMEAARGEAAEDRITWLRRISEHTVEVIAEPAWDEHDRLVGQVLQLNDDLIAAQRTAARRQRELELAQDQAAAAADRIRQLETILLAGLTPRSFDEVLVSLMRTTSELLPGDRADLFLLDEVGARLVLRASGGRQLGTAAPPRPVPLGEGVLGQVAHEGRSVLIERLSGENPAGIPDGQGSMIAAPLMLDGQVIGVLSASGQDEACFAEADQRLLELVGERVALAIGQAQLRDREQRMAETLQRTLLPQRLPQPEGVHLAARYLPHTAGVGGDFYDAVLLPDGGLGVAIGDVTGKGLRAAATMGRLRSALHAYGLDSRSPTEVLSRVGRLAAADATLATALYLVLDPATGAVQLASAGHLPPLLITPAGADYVDVRSALSPPLGLDPDREKREMTLDLEPGCTLLLYTDGLVEGTRNIDEGMGRLADAAAAHPDETPEALCERLLDSLAPGGRYRDDVAVLAVRRSD